MHAWAGFEPDATEKLEVIDGDGREGKDLRKPEIGRAMGGVK